MSVSRRDFLIGGAAVGSRLHAALPRDSLSPEVFGAKGDGVADDYVAWLRFVAELSNSVNVSARLGKGKVYSIRQHATAGNGITDLIIRNAVGLSLDGNGATLSFDGSFDRSSASIAGIGLALVSCRNTKVFDLTLNGNVQNTSNSSRSIESAKSYGLQVNGCFDCQLDKIETHHFATDGFAVGGSSGRPVTGSKRITISSLDSHHNGRSNISVFLAEYVTFKNCSSTYAGTTNGAYPGHSPLCGLDIEPDQSLQSGTGDINTNNIHFQDCLFRKNRHSDINAVLDKIISNVTFTRCRVESQDSPGSPSSILVGVPGVVFSDCYLDLASRQLELSAGGSGRTTHLFQNCDILGSSVRGSTLVSQFTSAGTRFNKCRFRCTAKAPKSHNFFTVNNRNFIFEQNTLFIPAAYFLNEGAGACKIFDVIMRRAMDNRYSTDLHGANRYFYTKWNTTEVVDDKYVGMNPGRADTFRPFLASTFDTTRKYRHLGIRST